MKLYNTLTKSVGEFVPQEPNVVKIYSCGVTTYDEMHLGHARQAAVFDVLRNYLEYLGYNVIYVRNFTDIDDKIINRANELKIDWQELVKKYIDKYTRDLEILGIEKGDVEPRATENIAEMIKHIEGLIKKDYAYVTESGVYFSVRKFKDYGKLSGQSIDQMLTGVRKETDETRKDPLDFALWKKSKEDEPFWESPWMKGRPGWHIECSVMSQKFLATDTLDIHAGGRDLIFPHHENEIAQSSSAGGQPLAKYFLHGEHLLVDDHKMSKSLKNFYTIDDILSKGFDPLAFRLLVLQAHYRHQLNFTWRSLEAAQAFLQRLQTWADLKFQPKLGHKKDVGMNYTKILTSIKQSLSDDLNSGQGLAILSGLVNRAEQEGVDTDKLQLLLEQLDELLGLDLAQRSDISNSVKDLISARETARKKSDWARADELRKKLSTEGIELNDTPHGPVWTRS